MGFFGFVFWMVVIWMIIRYMHRREGRRMVGVNGWYDSGEFIHPRKARKRALREQSDQQPYIESLESRVSELEERLDFTERLLAEKRDPAKHE